jgi:hypothetical protein
MFCGASPSLAKDSRIWVNPTGPTTISYITNANWDDARFEGMIQEGLKRRDALKAEFMDA